MRETAGTEFGTKELLAFGNQVFGAELPEGGFSALLPKLSSGTVDERNYKVIEEDGKIAAMLLSLPLRLRMLDKELKISYIGLVCVAEEARGKGYMRLLLKKAIREMKEEGTDLSILGGQRQRYGYFGYEPAGFEICQTLTEANGRHALKNVDSSENGVFTQIFPMSPDGDAVTKAYSLYCTKDYGVIRRQEGFYQDLCSWVGIPYEIRQNGNFAGYLSVDGRSEKGKAVGILEIVLKRDTDIPAALKACLEFFRREGYSGLKFVLSSFDELNHELAKICESIEIRCNHSFLVIDYVRVLKAALSWKAAKQGLVDGRAVLVIDGKRILITVDNGSPQVREDKTEAGGEPALSLIGNEAVRLLFSPAGCLMQERMLENESGKRLPAGWFPIELYLSGMDAC